MEPNASFNNEMANRIVSGSVVELRITESAGLMFDSFNARGMKSKHHVLHD